MKKVYIKEEVCMGCHLCEVHCQLEHSTSKDLIKAFKREGALTRLRIEANKPIFFSLRCQHCKEPTCVFACLTGALNRDPDSGKVTVDEAKCMGCWTCILACPFGAIKQDINHGKIVKCDLCPGKDVPVCVTSCPNEALIYAEASE